MMICYLAGDLEDLKSYFRWGLRRICQHWHEAFGLVDEKDNKYDFDQLIADKVLLLVGPFRCRGRTADVVFLKGMKRQCADTKYQGLMKKPK